MAERIVNFSDPVQKAKVLSYFRNLDGNYRLTVVQQRSRRSDAQNRYMWGVVIPYVAAGLQEAWGESLTNEEVHEFLKDRFLSKPVVNRVTGEQKGKTLPSSAKLTTTQFIEYIEHIARFSAEDLGVAIPHPNEELGETPAEKILNGITTAGFSTLNHKADARSLKIAEALKEAVERNG